MAYRYQEYKDGVHNYNDDWLISLGICDLIRKFIQVHTAVGRSVEALEEWLQLRPNRLPRSVLLNAYLHFEALSDHCYGFECVLCGHYPPMLSLDVDKKGIFELAVSDLELPAETDNISDPDMVDSDSYWNQVCNGILYRGFIKGVEKNTMEVFPSYNNWSPYVGPNCRRGPILVNSEHRKAQHRADINAYGASPDDLTIEKLMDLFTEGKVSVIRDLARKLGIDHSGSKLDIAIRMKHALNCNETFLKLFTKMWGGSGGWLGLTCRHGVCYGLKWLLRHEGPRDHVDMLMNLASLPNIVVVDMANMIVAHARRRGFDVFNPNEGRVAAASEKNIESAKNETLKIDWPWFPHSRELLPDYEHASGHQTLTNPVTGCKDHFCLFDPFHEANSSNPADILRRTGLVKQLAGKMNLETAEQLNNRRNRDNYFTTSMNAHNAVFVERLVTHFCNEKINGKIFEKHRRKFGDNLVRNINGQLVINPSCSVENTTEERQPPPKRPRECIRRPTGVLDNQFSDASISEQSFPSEMSRTLSTGCTVDESASSSNAQLSGVPASTVQQPILSVCANTPSDSLISPLANSATPKTSPPVSNPSDVRCLQVGNTGTHCWIFPASISQSTLDGRNGSSACTIITLILGKTILDLDLKFPLGGQLNKLWYSLVEKCIRLGNRIYDETQLGVRNLSPEEAVVALRPVSNIVVEEPLAVRLSDPHEPSRLIYQLEKIQHQKSAAIFVCSGKSYLMMSSEDGSMLVVDTHSHGSDKGTVITSASVSGGLTDFIKGLESIFELDQSCFGNFVKFH